MENPQIPAPAIPSNAIALHNALADTSQREHVQKMLSELLITISDKSFVKQTISIDGYRFINCSFTDCKLNVLRGTFEFHHCTIKTSKRLFDEGALKCVQIYALDDERFKTTPNFAPKSHPDGSFSIAKGASFQ